MIPEGDEPLDTGRVLNRHHRRRMIQAVSDRQLRELFCSWVDQAVERELGVVRNPRPLFRPWNRGGR